ncbi:hypothetical protein CMI37_10295, partial [Candidatus Pacearchaeota archaeon]|nr:hypothetical protein [Candidatus Pacearchaeota archaeon]
SQNLNAHPSHKKFRSWNRVFSLSRVKFFPTAPPQKISLKNSFLFFFISIGDTVSIESFIKFYLVVRL